MMYFILVTKRAGRSYYAALLSFLPDVRQSARYAMICYAGYQNQTFSTVGLLSRSTSGSPTNSPRLAKL
jgi:hypothetical protein